MKPGSGWPTPEPGDVLSYAYLWAREAATEREEGLKDRPVVVVLATTQTRGGTQLMVAPVTHSAPDVQAAAIEMLANVKHDLGLDWERSWIVVTEVNRLCGRGRTCGPCKTAVRSMEQCPTGCSYKLGVRSGGWPNAVR